MECSCRLWPTPGMYAVTSMPLVRRTRATLRSAEFGFFGVVVYTRVQTPRRWGEPFSAGVLVFSTLSSRPLRTSWLIVGMGGLDLLPALGWCSLVLANDWFLLWCAVPAHSGRQSPSGPRGRACRPSRDPADVRRTGIGRPSRLGVATFRPKARRWTPATGEASASGHPGAPRTGAGPGTLGTADHSTRASEAGQSRVPHMHGHGPAAAHRGGRHPGQRCAAAFDSPPRT